MDRRTYLSIAGASLTSIAGCAGTSSTGGTSDAAGSDGTATEQQTGVLSTSVSDDPGAIGDFEKLIVPIHAIRVFPESEIGDSEDATESSDTENETETGTEQPAISLGNHENETQNETSDSETPEPTETEDHEDHDHGTEKAEETDSEESADGPITIPVDTSVDLVKLQGDAQTMISKKSLPVGDYSHLQLRVGDDVNAVLKDGSKADVMTPGDAPLKFNKEFKIESDTVTSFLADFSPKKRGPNGYVLKPVAEEVTVNYEDLETEAETESKNTTSETGTDA